MRTLLGLLLLFAAAAANADVSVTPAGAPNRPFFVGATLPSTCNIGDIAFDSDAVAGQNLFGCTAANTWTLQAGGGGAPTDAQFWTGAADATLSAEKNLGALGTGLVINTAGVPSIYAGSSPAACSSQLLTRVVTNASGVLTFTCVTVGSGYLASGLALVTPDIGAATGASLALSGNITAANLLTSGTITSGNFCKAGSATSVDCNVAPAAGQVLNNATFTATPTLGASGTLGSITMGNATSGTVTLRPVTGALGSVTVSVPAATDTLVGKATTDVFQNKTFDASDTGNVLKLTREIQLTHPDLVDGTGCTVGTTSTAIGYGRATCSNSADEAANYMEWYITVPDDIDTAVAITAKIKVLLGNTDTGTHRYVMSTVAVADSAVPTASTLANAINCDFAGDASGANGDVETVSCTLTGWAAAMTAGRTWRIRLARDGNATEDGSTVNSTVLGVKLVHGVSQ